jgi:hypothetical protein
VFCAGRIDGEFGISIADSWRQVQTAGFRVISAWMKRFERLIPSDWEHVKQ